MKYVVPICALLTLSCTGILDGKEQERPVANGPSAPGPTSDGQPSGTGGTGSMTAVTPFGVRTGEPELLPFDVRVRRVANTLGVPVTNPMFDEMMTKPVQLGDYNHAQGALPDNLWLARRIATWADALAPVCASPEMKAKFPALPANAAELIKAAWGRAATDEELGEINTATTESGVTPNEAYEATCMAVFTAAEFVFR